MKKSGYGWVRRLLRNSRISGVALAAGLGLLAAGPADAFRADPGQAPGKGTPSGHFDIRVNASAPASLAPALAAAAKAAPARGQALAAGLALFKESVPGADVRLSPLTAAPEVVSAAGALSGEAPGRPGADIVRDFLAARAGLYGLGKADLAGLRFIGESVSPASGLRMVRVEQVVNGLPVFQSETRFILDRQGRLFRSVGLLVPDAAAAAPAPAFTVSAPAALAAALASVGLVVDPAAMTAANASPDGFRTDLTANDARLSAPVRSSLVYFPAAPGVLVPAWSQVSLTEGRGDWYTLVDANTGALLWRKNIRAEASTQEAQFSVYVQADGLTPADSPAPSSPTAAAPGSGYQAPGIERTTVKMSDVQDLAASPNGWISDGGETTVGNNANAYLDRASPANIPDTDAASVLDGNGRPVGNPDADLRNRDFSGTAPRDFTLTPPPQSDNPEAGQTATGNGNNGTTAIDAFRRGSVTHLFYLANWYHDQLFALGFDEAAGNFQTLNFSGLGLGGDAVLAEAQDNGGVNNANFSTPPDGQAGRMQMFRFTGPTIDRDGGLDAEIVLHELTHGLSNRIIGNGAGLNWDIGGGLGEGWSDFYALSLLNNTAADDPDGLYAAGAYVTYKLSGLTNNYVSGIRRFPYSTDNTVNPLTWADVDDTTLDEAGGIAPSMLGASKAGGAEVHNSGELWALTLWEVRSRVIADPAGANGDVPAGNRTMLQLVTDAMKLTPINPSFIDGRDALLAADAIGSGGTNEASIWNGFADRGLGYGAVEPFGRVFGFVGGHVGVGESFEAPYLDVASVTVDDSLGNDNGAIDPGEPVKLTVTLKNPWRGAAFGVDSATAALACSTPGVIVSSNQAVYAAIPALGSAAGTPFELTVPIEATAGQALHFTITPSSALGSRAVDFTLRIGTPDGNGDPVTYTRTIEGGLAIPDVTARGVVDTLTITDDVEIADLDFRIDNLTHTFVGDLTAMLRAPNGVGIDLVSAIGGLTDGGSGDNLVNTVIDDQATGDLLMALQASAPYTGSWLPAFNGPSWDQAGYAHDPVGLLSRYNGLSTKGDWKILVSDQFAQDTGLLNAWSLIVTPKTFVAVPFTPPDFTNLVASPSPARLGAVVTLTFTASEALGADPAVEVNGHAASFLGRTDNAYSYQYTIGASDSNGVAVIAIAGRDEEGNLGTATNAEALVVDTIAPTITAITSASTNGTYDRDAAIDVTLAFSEPVTLAGGDLRVTLETGATDRQAVIVPIAATNRAAGLYTVVLGDVSADLSVKSVALQASPAFAGFNGSPSPQVRLRDAAGNDAVLALPAGNSLEDNQAIVISTTCRIEASAGPGGIIAPSGTVLVAYGNEARFMISADAGYHISSVLLNDNDILGEGQFPSASLSWASVITDATVRVAFAMNAVTVRTDQASVTVPEGGTATFQAKLNAQPTGTIVVAVGPTAGDGDVSVSGGASLTFTTNDWADYQTVTLAAAEDDGDNADGSATITLGAAGIASAGVTADEDDDDFALAVTAPHGTVIRDPDTPYYDSGSTVTLTAVPLPRYFFTGWSGDADGTTNTVTLTMDGDKSVTALFEALMVALPPKAIFGTKFRARWQWVEGAAPEGEVSVSPVADFSRFVKGYKTRYVANGTSCTVTNLVDGRDYWYRVRRLLPGGGESPWSAPVQVRTGGGMPGFRKLLDNGPASAGITQEFELPALVYGTGTVAVTSSDTNAVGVKLTAGALMLAYRWNGASTSATVRLVVTHPESGAKASYRSELSKADGSLDISAISALTNAGSRAAQELTLVNGTGGMIYGVRIRAGGLDRADWLLNRTGLDPATGAAIREVPCVLPAGGQLVVRLVYDAAVKSKTPNPPAEYGAWAILTPRSGAAPAGDEQSVTLQERVDGLRVVGIPANRSRLYSVYLSDDDGATWDLEVPALRATANYLMWMDLDAGAPPNRLYRIVDTGM